MSGAFSATAFWWGAVSTTVKVLARLFVSCVLRLAWWGLLPKPMYHLGGLTPARLTSILRKAGKITTNNKVLGMEWKPVTGGTMGMVQRVAVTYDSPYPTNAPDTLIVKAFGTKAFDFAITTVFPMATTEHNCYTFLTQDRHVSDVVPQVYGSYCNQWLGMSVVIMEDLQRLRHKSSLTGTATKEEAKTVLRTVGRLHAHSWEDTALKREFLHRPVRFLDESVPGIAEKLLKGTRLDPYPKFKAVLAELRNFEELTALHNEFRGSGVGATGDAALRLANPSVLMHGDLRLENIFFDDASGKVKLVDWQVSMPRQPLEELTYFMHDIDPAIAQDPSQMREVFAVYCDTLAANGVSGRSFVTPDELVAGIPRVLRYNVLKWMYPLASVKDTDPEAAGLFQYVSRCEGLLGAYPSTR